MRIDTSQKKSNRVFESKIQNLVQNHLDKVSISSYQKIIDLIHANIKQEIDLNVVTDVLRDMTISLQDRFFLKTLKEKQDQIMRDKLLELFMKKESYKVKDLRKEISSELEKKSPCCLIRKSLRSSRSILSIQVATSCSNLLLDFSFN